MEGKHRYPRTPVLILLMVLFSLTVVGNSDSRLHIGGYDWDFVDATTIDNAIRLTEGSNRVLLSTLSELQSSREQGEPSDDSSAETRVFKEDNEADVAMVEREDTDKVKSADIEKEATEEREPPEEIDEADKKDEAEEKKEERPKVLVHKVQSGETLWDIAKAYGITVDTILAANDITNSNRIRVGQELQILTVSGVLHPVASGESLWEISSRYNIPMDKIVEANEIRDPSRIQPNTKLVIPGATQLRPRDVLVVSGQLQKAFDWPTRGRISSPFGPRWGRMHNGIDIAVPTGTPIRAAASGTVTFSGWNGGYGYIVMIDHGNGVETRYAHNSRLVASVGQRVDRGQIVAYSGNTGNSTGPHLHFEIRHRGQPYDPQRFLR